MQALAEMAARDQTRLGEIKPLLDRLTQTGTPAMRARGRKLLLALARGPSESARARFMRES